MQEIAGAVINADYVTNDLGTIEAALCAGQQVEYISRNDARFAAYWLELSQWNVLVNAPAVLVIVDGVCYRRIGADSSTNFPVSSPSTTIPPTVSG